MMDRFLNEMYVNQILEPLVVPYAARVGRNFVYMHDNARLHTAVRSRHFLEENQIEVLPWPAQSPDLNPIEHAWDRLQKVLMQGHQYFENRQELFAGLQMAWREIPQEYFQNLKVI